MEALALLLHGLGGMGFSMLGRLLAASDMAVLKWVRAQAAALPEPEILAAVVAVAVDEMRRYLEESLPSSGPAKLWAWRACGLDGRRAVALPALLASHRGTAARWCWAGVMTQLAAL